MRLNGFSGLAVAGLAMVAAIPLTAGTASARSHAASAYRGAARVSYAVSYSRVPYAAGYGRSFGGNGFGHHAYSHFRYSYSGGHLQCVPYARENTGIELSGNAATWWASAAGLYERGARPEVGSVLNFRATGRMRMGHVAVVSNVIDSRSVEIDHANWSGPGAVTHDIRVVDVSPDNDWTAVRVALDHSGEFGSVYPTYGFIYDRPDHGTMVANSGVAPMPVLNAAPADLRSPSERMLAAAAPQEAEEVAEADAGDDPAPRVRRFGRHVIRVYSRGVFHGRQAGRPAQVIRIHSMGFGMGAPAPHAAAGRRHGRA